MSPRPPVTRLVLYKHGMALVGRRGPIDGEFTLTFRRDDMKDVLKSLVVDIADGQASVGAVTFDTPADPEGELADRHLLFDSGKALAGLLDGLRGRAVEVRCGARRHRGAVIGVDDAGDQRTESAGGRHLVLRTDAGQIGLVDLAEADGLTVLEDSSRADLEYLIDRSRAITGGSNCEVGVAVRGQARDARISYLVAAPVWRVSYRIIGDGAGLRLVAMGIVHNPVDEDLTDVEVTVTTGQPISFEIDLYQARYVQRVALEEQERVFAPRRARDMVRSQVMLTGADAADAYEEAAGEVATADRGEYFEYRLTSPVSLKRGGAAMVPLAVASVSDVRRELVWRHGFGPAPEVVWAFPNTTGLVLEEGPAVVYEHDGYAGEAMVDFTARGAPVRLGFAKDLAVRCGAVERRHTVTTRVRLATEALIEERREECRHTLRAENDHDHPVEVIFELPRVVGHHIADHDGATPAGDDAADRSDRDWHRFRVAVPAHQVAEATVVEAWPVRREIDYEDLAPGRLEAWLAGRSLDAETVAALSGVLAHWEQAGRLDEQRERAEATRADLHEAQRRITEHLEVLGTDGDEGRLRSRQVGALARLQDRVGELDADVHRLRVEADAARSAATDALHRLIS